MMNTYETAGMNMACFESILKMTQGELKEYLAQQLRVYGYEPVCENGFLYAEGTVPVLLVAHLDTVHKSVLMLDPIKLTTFQIDEYFRPQ